MLDPKEARSQDEEETTEGKPELEAETLKDLTPPEVEDERVKGGGALQRGCAGT